MQSGKFKFEKLQVWQLAMDFGESIYKLSETFPALEKFNLVSQINRAVDSVALNIAEGATGNSDAEFDRFLGYSLRSLAEVVTCLFKAIRRNYLSEEAFDKHYEDAFVLMNKIAALRNSISK
jgi:four helix bundle protein